MNPPGSQQLLTGWLLQWVTFCTQDCDFRVFGMTFWVPGTPFWLSWGPGGHPMDTQMPRCPFLMIFDWIWGPSWSILWRQFCDFLWFGVASRGKVSRSMFLVLCGWKRCQNAMTECAITTLKTKCFEWFHFFYFFSNSGSRVWDLGHILMSFGRPGVTFSDFWGSWRQAENFMIFERFPRGARAEVERHSGGNALVCGPH